jgi:hypothetical protein
LSAQVKVLEREDTTFIFKNELMGKLATIIMVFGAFYYPIGVLIIVKTGISSTPVNIGFRSITALCSTFLIFIYLINKNKILRLSKSLWIMLAWWLFYGSRIIFDLSRGIKFGDYGNEFVYGITFGNITIPIISAILWRDYLDFTLFKKVSYVFIVIACFSILLVIIDQVQNLNSDIFLQRLELYNNKGRAKEQSVLNPIAIGFYGELLIILTFLKVIYIKRRLLLLIDVLLIILGILLLMFGASRGPFFTTVAIIMIILFTRFSNSKSKVVLLSKYVLIVITLSIVLSKTLLKNFTLKDFSLFNRVLQFIKDRSNNKSDTRLIHIESAWQDFYDSPIFGKQFVGTLDGFYPHNIIVEVFMATGIIGAILFFPLLFIILRKTFSAIFSKNFLFMFLGFIFLPNLFNLLTSGCLFQGVEFWLMGTLVLLIKPQNRFSQVNVIK